MPRRNSPPKRAITPDPVYGSELISRFINRVMTSGKRGPAERIVYGALEKISSIKTIADSALEILNRAIDNVMPIVEVKSRRVGGATYQVPVEVNADRGSSLAMRWIIAAAKARNEKDMASKLAGELLDAAGSGEDGDHGRGGAIKKRDDVHKMAEANKAFSHYRWGNGNPREKTNSDAA